MKLLLSIILVLFFYLNTIAQSAEKHVYNGKTYTVQIGPRGGKYILLADSTKHYLSLQSPVVKGNVALYKNKSYPLQNGPRGGKYFLYENRKIYVKD